MTWFETAKGTRNVHGISAVKAKWNQKCGLCERWLRKGRLIYRVRNLWTCEECAR